MLNKYASHRTASFVELGFNYSSASTFVWISLIFINFGNQKNHFKQSFQTDSLLGGHIHKDRISAPLFRN
ncbi:hypothetical protein D3C81_1548740 [compost metagenome]